MNWIQVRIHRILGRLEKFTYSDSIPDIGLGRVFGFYENSASGTDRLLFCQDGICLLLAKGDIKIRFDQIEDVQFSRERSSDSLMIRMKNNDLIVLPVKGGDGHALDVMEVLRFVRRVLSDRERDWF